MSANHIFEYDEESNRDKLARKSKEAPIFPIGIGALTMACIYGGYMFKKRGNMSPSVYLMHLRVGAQGAVVGCLTLGLIYTMAKEHLWKDDKKN